MKTILLLRPDKGGDAIKTLPVLHALQKQGLELHVLTSVHNASLFAGEPGVTLHQLSPGWERRPREEADRIGITVDCAINLLCDPTEATFRLLAEIPATERFQARHASIGGDGVRFIDLPDGTPAEKSETENIAFLVERALGISLSPAEPAPRLLAEDRVEACREMGEKHGRWIGFCPLAGTNQRTPPLVRWRRLFEFALGQLEGDDRLFLFAGPDEAKRLAQWGFGVNQASSFRALGAYFERLDGVVAVDSGPLHLARAVDVPTLGFLSGGDQARWFPELGDKHRIVPRGILTRFPLAFEMIREYRAWHRLMGAIRVSESPDRPPA